MSEKKKSKIGVVGAGTVGTALIDFYRFEGYEVAVYDPDKGHDDRSVLDDSEIIFACLPTPVAEAGYDLTHLEAGLSEIPDGKTVLIKSTVLPGTTILMQDMFPGLNLYHNPEFLSRVTAFMDVARPVHQLLGVPQAYSLPIGKGAYSKAEWVASFLPASRSRTIKVCHSEESEYAKVLTNAFYSVKLAFFESVYDVTGAAMGAEITKGIMSEDPWIGASHMNIFQEGSRGWGGCLVKDAKAVLGMLDSDSDQFPVLEAAHDFLEELTEGNR